ncbi:hypothetical protein K0U00_07575, partial [Paenibacillus sepulcri]|nr:hypothetical protein [Paenibacillus sepulcri]
MGLEAFRIDFSMNHGHEMIVDRESGITREMLDEIEIHMLQAQKIPKLLDVEWIDIDGRVSFRYPLNGKRMLMHKLQSHTLTMGDFYLLLLAIVEAIDDCQHYMLRPAGFMLHEQYLFVGERWQDIGLAYIPLSGEGVLPPAGEAMLAMAVRWIAHIDQPDGIGLQRVFQHLKGEYISWGALRQTLLTLVQDHHLGVRDRVPVPPPAESIQLNKGRVIPGQPNSLLQPVLSEPGITVQEETISRSRAEPLAPKVEAAAGKKAGDGRFSALPEGGELPFLQLDDEEARDEADAGSSRPKWILGCLFILAAALIWRYLYMASPTRTSLLISLGLTLMVGAGMLFYKRKVGGSEDSDLEGESVGKWSDDEEGFVPDSSLLNRGSVTMNHELPAVMSSWSTRLSGLKAQALAFAQGRPPVPSGPSMAVPDVFSDASAMNHSPQGFDYHRSNQQSINDSDAGRGKAAPSPSFTVPSQEGSGPTQNMEVQQDITVLLGGDAAAAQERQLVAPWLER